MGYMIDALDLTIRCLKYSTVITYVDRLNNRHDLSVAAISCNLIIENVYTS